MASFIQSVDARTRLAGANQFEVLLFSLGRDLSSDRDESFGINVFKVREVLHAPEITRAPDMPAAMEGMVSLRGVVVPVIHLPRYCGIQSAKEPRILIVTEYNRHVQAFLVDSVDCIERLAWQDVKDPPPMMIAERGGLVTAVTEIRDGRLVMIVDVEQILADMTGFHQDHNLFSEIESVDRRDFRVLFADDSRVARDQIARTLDQMGLPHMEARNGAQAWQKLNELADEAERQERDISDMVKCIVTDVEMPEMDGYVLTQKIKEDERFKKIPVIMHSSLSAEANHSLGAAVGADLYVPKFHPQELADAISGFLG